MLKKTILSTIILSSIVSICNGQTIFSYGNNNVPTAELIRSYSKNSMSQKVDYSEKAIKDYIDLYSLFKMKITEAKNLQLDTQKSVENEINNYRRQLAKSFLTDEQLNEKLVEEAYSRLKNDVRVAHILLITKPGRDTVALKKQIDSIYIQILNKKADFGAMAKLFSEDNGSKNNGGDIGYFTALQTTYPFESMAYNTPVGKISKPFKTAFGYHILKVIDKRPTKGSIKVAQILVATPKAIGEQGLALGKLRADTIQNKLKKGESFEKLVKEYSDDKFSIDNNGVLETFSIGKMTPDFENAAFALKNPGDISKTIHTEYGYHIIKLIAKYPIKSFEDSKAEITKKIENDSRAQFARDAYFEKVKQNNGFIEYNKNWEILAKNFTKIEDTGANIGVYTPDMFETGSNNPLFSLSGKNYTQNDFMEFAANLTQGKTYIKGDKEPMFKELYKMYKTNIIHDFQEHKLEEENADFKNLMTEYKDGVLLFDLMNKKVWNKASEDTVGLKAFYQLHKEKYQWEPGFKGNIYTFKNADAFNEGKPILDKKGMTDELLIKTLNNEKVPDAIKVEDGRFEFNKFSEIPRSQFVNGKFTEPIKTADGIVIIKTTEIFNIKEAKSFNDAKGYFISSYQDKLEKEWNKELRNKYPVKINEVELKKIIK